MIVRIAVTVVLAGPFVLPIAARGATPAALAAADRAAVFKAAGFQERGGRYIRCEEETPTASYVPGAIEVADLNGDGRPEAWVTESSLFCYGNTGSMFVLVTQEANGTWRTLIDEVGMQNVLESKQGGWPDIEVGGPGFGKFPVYRWSGQGYVKAP